MVFEPVQRSQLHDEVVKQLRDSIDNGNLQPGERLPSERELASALDVSRNVLREALRVLEANGLVYTKPGVGRMVRVLEAGHPIGRSLTDSLELATIDEVLETRALLECEIVVVACDRRTDDEATAIVEASMRQHSWNDNLSFHVLIAASTHNSVLERLVFDHLQLLNRLRQRDRYYSEQDTQRLLSEHNEIAQAILNRDGQLGADLMRQHLEETKDRITKGAILRNRGVMTGGDE